MDNLLYIAMSGATEIMQSQTIHANNLANVGTNGFRADLEQARALQVYGEGLPARVYAGTEVPGTDMRIGPMNKTGRSLDVAIQGQGLLAVLTADGTEAYTRAGNLSVDAVGQLRTGLGYRVLGTGGPIALPPFESLLVGGDGTVSVRPEGQPPDVLVQVDRLRLVNPEFDAIVKGQDGLFRAVDALVPLPVDLNVGVVPGFLESSNVNAVHEMTRIVELAREFEIQFRLMQTAEENDQAAASLVSIN